MAGDDRAQQLVEKARDGDRPAFDELAMAFRDRLRSSVESWSRFQLGPKLDPEEVLQETFVRAFRALGTFQWQGEDAFFRWLCGVAKHAVAQLAQDARRGGPAGTTPDVPISGPTQSKVARRHERFERLEAALQELSPEYRQVILLSRIEGLTAPEIAERIGRSANAVRHLIVRALRELREKFGDTASFHLPDRQLEVGGNDDGE